LRPSASQRAETGGDRRLAEGLAALDRAGLARTRRVLDSPQAPHAIVDGRQLVNFSSNDYLGLANHSRLRAAAHAAIDAWGVGAGASPLVSGYQRVHEEAEERFARFSGLQRALLFPSGYAANLGIIQALASREAEVFGDRLNHACLHDGALLSRATYTRYRHLDVEGLERALAASKAPVKLIATDGVFSMDGDIAPLPGLARLAEAHGAWLLVDDAHGVGVLGARGRGSLEHFELASPRIVYMATLGKALGGYGAFVAGAAEPIEWLLQRARTLIYSTALPPMAAAVATAALDLIDEEPDRIARLRARIESFRAHAGAAGLRTLASITAIQPLVLGESSAAVDATARLAQRGFLVPAIRPPTVPQGTARLRISLCADHLDEEIEALVAALADCVPP
jgi:8-amino-7-oxononanoate synthase